jgi:hypothetical protein
MERRSFFSKSAFGAMLFGMSSPLFSAVKSENDSKELNIDVKENHQFDVIVCGGGPAGIAAALSAAGSGAKTALIELQGCLGGTWTAGLLCNIIDYENKQGIMKEIMNNLDKKNTQKIPKRYDPEAMKLVLDEMAIESGVHIRLHTRVTNANVEKKNRITHITTHSKSGQEKWNAKVFIDCTGDGDMAALAGAGYAIGHPVSGKTQPMSYVVMLAGVNSYELHKRNLIITYPSSETHATAKKNFLAEIRSTGLDPSYSKQTLFDISNNLVAMMANHQYNVSALNANDITKATIEARKEVNAIVDGLRKLGGVWKDVFISQTPENIGVREGRRIAGRYTLTADDLIRGATFEDAVCRVTFCVDIHSLDPSKHKAYSSDGVEAKPYDIPLRSLIAKDIDGLMMAGRCISGDFYAHGSYRVTGNAVPMGEAAGKCAAYAVKKNLLPHEVKFSDIG